MNERSKLRYISYFSDFIFMQQLMTLEIDIIIGQTQNKIAHLQDEEDDMDDNPDVSKLQKESKKPTRASVASSKIRFKFDAASTYDNQGGYESNSKKIS